MERIIEKYRPFKDENERIGAMRCGLIGSKTCNKPSEWVQYLPMGRTILCNFHYHKLRYDKNANT